EKPALLEDLNAITAAMDEGAMTEYIAILTQIQSLLDSGMSEAEVQAMFPEINFSTALEQIASIQAFLNNREVELPGLTAMFGDALPEEVLTIATDLDMTGAQARWAEFAANPGVITTDAVIAAYTEAENVEKLQPQVDAFIAKYGAAGDFDAEARPQPAQRRPGFLQHHLLRGMRRHIRLQGVAFQRQVSTGGLAMQQEIRWRSALRHTAFR
ncbi:MAG: hypothetical protein SOX18_01025, partial [Lachnospiraceae bacterium]|nr:hypothetical protein [Lachnospiraceae bacterium]